MICRNIFFPVIVFFIWLFSGCRQAPSSSSTFVALDHTTTGLDFTNKLQPTPEFNMFKYMYFYNGAGVGAGDFNNDGCIDLFFSSNQKENKIFLNEGGLHFKDVTVSAKIPQDGGWSTGVSVADVNDDKLLDIYVCRVGQFETLKGKNQLLICQGIGQNGIPYYADKASEYGLDFSGFSTQAAFFDYDLDGDLDMYLMNHSVHQNGTFAERKVFLGTYHSLSGDRLYRNDASKFTDVTKESQINSSAIGYGLGIAVADINLDGYPDLYIGNDFHENDYLYINQKNGTFKEDLAACTEHTSQFSMGVDIADINNDAYPEIISMDMLPSDPYILKRSLGEDEYNIFNMKLNYGYHPQYAKNSLQLNRGNGVFSDVAMYSNVFATDWSWAPLWMDFDNDGLKDLFVSNGIPKRLNDIDYVNYVSNADIQSKIKSNRIGEKEMAVINNFPEIKLPNVFFSNKGNAVFENIDGKIRNAQDTYSNGAAYADLDKDGDLDIIVNNIDASVLVYENKSNDSKDRDFLELDLIGPTGNIKAVGSKLIVYANSEIRTYEKYPVRGFLSSMEIPLHIGLHAAKLDSVLLVWPDNTYQKLSAHERNRTLTMTYQPGLPKFDYTSLRKQHNITSAKDITSETGLLHKHVENPFVEFDREPLIPHMVSAEGPALAIADINKDGFDDVFIGSSKGNKSAIFLQGSDGRFIKMTQPFLDKDSIWEDVDACWADVNNDRHIDLVVASGGNEYYGGDEHQMPRVYLNDGKMNFSRSEDAFNNLFLTASCVEPYDINGDGYVDLFIGGRAVPWEYGQKPTSYLLINNGNRKFTDVTARYAKDLSTIGFVKNAVWSDLDGDGDGDLILSMEWDGIYAFMNERGSFIKKQLTNKKGWWNFTLPCDVDGDGDIDLIAGNTGLNNRLKPSEKQPVRLYYNDFDGNGKKEQVLTYYLEGREIPFANKMELEKQMPVLKKRFLYAEDFAKASLNELFTSEKLKAADLLTADYFNNVVLINDGQLKFEIKELPWEAQLTTYNDAAIADVNNDNRPDILLAGNFYNNNIQMSRYDADYGTVLINKGNGNFTYSSPTGLSIRGQVRHIRKFKMARGEAFIFAKNNDSTQVIRFIAN